MTALTQAPVKRNRKYQHFCKVCGAPRDERTTLALCLEHLREYQHQQHRRQRPGTGKPIGRRPTYGDACCVEGCGEARHSYAKGKRSRFCAAHHREHARQQRQSAVAVRNSVSPTPALTAADVYTRWGKDCLCDAYYAGLKVIGMVQTNGSHEAGCYRLTLADERHVWVPADAPLEREAQTSLRKGR